MLMGQPPDKVTAQQSTVQGRFSSLGEQKWQLELDLYNHQPVQKPPELK